MKSTPSITRAALTFCLIASCLLLGQMGGRAMPASKLTEAQAIQRASLFCRRIGAPVTVAGTAQYPTPPDPLEEPHWQKRWRVSFPGQATVEVVDATGIISDYDNDAYSARPNNLPAGEAISEQEAMQRATDVLRATGQVGETIFWNAQQLQFTEPPLAKDNVWAVSWHRALGAIPYDGDHVTVDLDAQTGEVTGMVLMFPATPPASPVMAVSREQATQIALAQMRDAGLPDAVFQSAKTQVVQVRVSPPTPENPRPPKQPRVAWVCEFRAGEHTYQVQVDVETGVVVGGGSEGYPGGSGKHAPQPKPSAKSLKTAKKKK